MTPFAAIAAGSAVGAGVALLVNELVRPAPALGPALQRLNYPGPETPIPVSADRDERWGAWLVEHLRGVPGVRIPFTDLALLGRTPAHFVLRKITLTSAGLLLPPVATLPFLLVGMPFYALAVLGLVIAAVFRITADLEVRDQAKRAREEFAHAMAAFLDLVALKRAGNTGAEQAMEEAAAVGHGWAFQRPRSRRRSAGSTPQPRPATDSCPTSTTPEPDWPTRAGKTPATPPGIPTATSPKRPSLSPKYRATPTRRPSPARHSSTPSHCPTANTGGPSRPASPTGSAPGSGSPTSKAHTRQWYLTARGAPSTPSRATWATSWPPASSTPTRVPPSPHGSPPPTCPTPTGCARCRPGPAASDRCGTVWPHDTAISVTGLARTGHPEAAARLIEGILAAAPAFDYRLPELWGGDARTDTPAPVPYPAACQPQAWSAAAAIALMTALTGLEPDVPAGRLHLRPTGPLPVGALTVTGLTVAGERLDITIGSDGRIESVTAPEGLIVEEHPAARG